MTLPERCPADRDIAPWLWEHNKSVLDDLRGVVEPLAEELSSCVEADVAMYDGVNRETLATPVQDNIPFGMPYTLLPPRLFSGLEDGPETPTLPEDEAEAHKLIQAYSARCQEPPIAGMPKEAYTTTPQERMGHILHDILWMMDRGTSIDPATWEQYRQAAREHARQGRYDLDMISLGRGNAIKNMYHFRPFVELAFSHATGRFDYFMTMPTAALDVDGQSFGLLPAGYLFMPHGAYGQRFGEKIMRTSAYMINTAQQVLHEKASYLAEAFPTAVEQHTTRRRDGRPADASLISVTQEGSRSTMEVIAVLTADKVSGYDDPDELLEAIVNQGIIEEFTRALPMGFLGPLVFSGRFFPNLLLHSGDGKLALNPDIMAKIKIAKREVAQQDMADWAMYWATPEEERKEKDMMPPTATHLLCPAVMPRGALPRMNGAFLRAYKAFDFKL